jgi:hypothetical protein
MTEIMNRMRNTHLEIEKVAGSLRQSQSSPGKLPLSETMIVDAVADVFLREIQDQSLRNSTQYIAPYP